MARQFAHKGARRLVAPAGQRPPLVFYSQVAWDTVWQRPQEQALGLAEKRPVLFVSPVQLHEWTERLSSTWEFCRTLCGGRLVVLSPLIFSGEYRVRAIRRLNARLLRRLLAPLRGRGATFMTNTPFCWHLVPWLHPRRVVYDLIDDFCAFEWAPPEGRALERKLLRRADLVLAGTGALQRQYRRAFPGLEFLPSGVQFERLTAPAPEPEDLAPLPRPRLLFVGTLNDKLDGALFRDLAEGFPAGSIALVGPRHETFRAPPLPPNVHHLGLKPHSALPGYYQHCDLGLMPFADSPAARAINPIKTLEYLACGLPVISTPIPDVVEYYKGVVSTAKPPDWVEEARRLLEQNNGEEQARRREFARGRSWDKLVRRMEEMIEPLEREPPCASAS